MAAAASKTEEVKPTIVERMLAIAEEVGVLEPVQNGGVPFAFRGIDAVVAKLTPLLNKYGVIVVPHSAVQVLDSRPVGTKTVTKADVHVTYRFYGAAGDYIDAEVVGQADDFADRSSAQAMSVAFRIALLQTFHIAAFGDEETASEETKNAREKAGDAKVENARAAAAKASTPRVDPAQQMRDAIVAAGGAKGWEPDKLTAFGDEVTGKKTDDWFYDPDALNLILSKINEAK